MGSLQEMLQHLWCLPVSNSELFMTFWTVLITCRLILMTLRIVLMTFRIVFDNFINSSLDVVLDSFDESPIW